MQFSNNFYNNQNYVLGRVNKAKIYSGYLKEVRRRKLINFFKNFLLNKWSVFFLTLILMSFIGFNLILSGYKYIGGIISIILIVVSFILLVFLIIPNYFKTSIFLEEDDNSFKLNTLFFRNFSKKDENESGMSLFRFLFILVGSMTLSVYCSSYNTAKCLLISALAFFCPIMCGIFSVVVKIENIIFYPIFLVISSLIYYYNRLKYLFGLDKGVYILNPKFLEDNEFKEITDEYVCTKGYLVFR